MGMAMSEGRIAVRNGLRVALPVLFLSACPGSLEDPDRFLVVVDDPDTGVVVNQCDYVVAQILSNTSSVGCARGGCHGAGAPTRGLDLETADLVGRLSNQPSSADCPGFLWVDPDTPSQSLLYTKVTANPPCGSRMPFGPPLPADDVACVLGWLEASLTSMPDAGLFDGGPPMDAGPPGDAGMPGVNQFVEAEAATSIRPPFSARADVAASGGEYVSQDGQNGVVNNDPDNMAAGLMTFNFSVPQTGTTVIWARTRAPTIDNNSFWVRVDAGAWIRYNNIPWGNAGFAWDDIHDSDNNDVRVEFNLTAGNHVPRDRLPRAGYAVGPNPD